MAARNSIDNKLHDLSNANAPNITAESRSGDEISKESLQQPRLMLIINRISSETIELINALTNEAIYHVRDTGRGSFSSKPDYELFRQGPSGLFVGSIRLGKRGTEVKLPLTGAKFNGVESYISESQGKLKWTATQFKRPVLTDQSKQDEARVETSWATTLDCYHDRHGGEEEPVCAVKLMDSFPNGRFEIWTKDACVDLGGDWHLLDELVTMSYANMEQARRRLIMGPTPAGVRLAGLGIGANFAVTI